jgi:PTS system nitrogen regulatory IIA component
MVPRSGLHLGKQRRGVVARILVAVNDFGFSWHMAKDDFDVPKLAAYLHLTPQQVTRLADRGKLPGRKVGGQWRFAQADIHHWLEQKIGVSDEEQLVEMEGVLERADRTADREPVSISDLLPLEAISIPLPARTRGSVIQKMVELASRTGYVMDKARMLEAVRTREELHPTALDNGIALMHPRRPMPSILARPLLAMGRTPQGIPFGGHAGALTDVFFLICSTADRVHLRVLARLSRLIADPRFLPELRSLTDAVAVRRLVRDAEARLSE